MSRRTGRAKQNVATRATVPREPGNRYLLRLESKDRPEGQEGASPLSRLSSVFWPLLGVLVAPWGCSTPPPPASSLPGKLAVESTESVDLVTANAEDVEVPAAAQPREGQIRLPEPDPDDGAGTLLVYTAITGQQPLWPGIRAKERQPIRDAGRRRASRAAGARSRPRSRKNCDVSSWRSKASTRTCPSNRPSSR